MKKPIRTFARMARLTFSTREEAERKMEPLVTSDEDREEVRKALDDAFAEDKETLRQLFLGAASAIDPAVKEGEGKDVDSRGHDAADRAVFAVMKVLDKETL